MQTTKDKNGKTEREFLRDYDVTKYFRPSVAVDSLLFVPTSDNAARILMIRRGGHPYIGMYAFPGGFVVKDESCEDAAKRELLEETGIANVPLCQLLTVSTPDRDPRWRNISVVFCGKCDGDIAATAGDDAADAKWFDVRVDGERLRFCCDGEKFECALNIVRDEFGRVDINKTSIVERGLAAFDHAKIIYYLLDIWNKQ